MRARKKGLSVVEATIVVAILLLVTAISFPALVQNHRKQQAARCAMNLDAIAAACREFTAQQGYYPESLADLVPGLLPALPVCPAGGLYQPGTAAGLPPACSIPGHHF